MIKHRSLYNEAIQEGMQLGVVKGRQEGRQEGIQEGIQEGMQLGVVKGIQETEQKFLAKFNDATLKLVARGLPFSFISEVTSIPESEIDRLCRENYDYIQSLADKMKAESQGEDEDDEDMEL